MSREKHIRVETLSLDELSREIELLHGPPSAQSSQGRFGELHRLIDWRRGHFFKRPEAKPILAPPYDKMAVYQSDKPRQVHRALKARLDQRRYTIHATPTRKTAAQQKAADAVELFFTFGLQNLEIRTGIQLQKGMSDGQIIDCYKPVHWRLAPDVYPPIPERQWLTEIPGDAEPDRSTAYVSDDGKVRHSRFRHDAVEYEEYDGEDDSKGRYRESATSWQERYVESKARAGYPWFVELVDPMSFSFVEDRSLANGMAKVLVVRRVPVPEYRDALRYSPRGPIYLSMHEQNKLIPVFGETDAPPEYQAGSSANTQGWPTTCYVATYWTRTEYYELVSTSGRGWELVRSDKHPYGMPPFAIAKAIEIMSPLPEERWWPALQGIYDTKPAYDRIRALVDALAEMIALPYFYIELAEGSPLIDPATGKILTLSVSRNALSSQLWPPGAKLVKIEYTMSQEMLNHLQRALQDMEDSAPSTGLADISATTRAWTARLGIQQADIEPAALIKEQAEALQIMVRNQAEVMSGGALGEGEAFSIFAQVKKGKAVEDTLVSITAEDIKNVHLDVVIDAVSQAESAAREQQGMELFEKGHITRRELDEDYRGVEDATEHEREIEADVLWRSLQPSVRQQLLRAYFGNRYILGTGGQIIGPDGQPFEPTGPPPPEVTQRTIGRQALEGIQVQRQMPQLPALATPGTVPIGGLP